MRTQTARVIACGLLILLSIGCESALSDVEIEDPSLLSLRGSVSFDGPNGESGREIEVVLSDKNSEPLKLKGGAVRVNGVSMPIEENFFGQPRYVLGSAEIEIAPSKEYVVEVQLASGDVHKASVVAPPQLLATLCLPAQHDPAEDLPVSWAPHDSNANTSLAVTIRGTRPTGATFSETSYYSPEGSSFLVPSADLSSSPGQNLPPDPASLATVSVTSTHYGSVSGAFRPGSSMCVTSTLSRDVSLSPTILSSIFIYLLVEVL